VNENREKEQVLPPTVRSLRGALKKGALGEGDYKKYLEEKSLDTGIPKRIEEVLAS